MSKPASLARLAKGKALGAFPTFVETFNYILDFIENLSGEGDGDSAKPIILDRSIPDHPVIRFNGDLGGTGELEVITDLQFAIEDGLLVAKLTKAKLKGVTSESVEYSQSLHRRSLAGVLVKDVIVKTHYNQSGDHEFKQDKLPGALVLYNASGAVPTQTTETVFTTTLHES